LHASDITPKEGGYQIWKGGALGPPESQSEMQNANGQQSALMHVMCKRFSGVGKGLSLAAVIDGQIEMAKSN